MWIKTQITKFGFPIVILSLAAMSCNGGKAEHHNPVFQDISKWETSGDRSLLLEKNTDDFQISSNDTELPAIQISETEVYQEMDGFGFTLTGGSAMLLQSKLSETKRAALLQELFSGSEEAVGINFLRISIGSSDLDEHVYSYADGENNQPDPDLKTFTLAYDSLYLVPILQQILKINPDLKIMGSPWSPPAWMKTNNSPIGGKLKPEYYAAYAQYFVRYIQAMKAAGIPIYAITIQNEPEHPGNNPSMLMEAHEQAEFVKSHLGPAFEKEEIDTKIIIFDHNCDNPGYPIEVLNDTEARKYIDGSAFHLYLGDIEALSEVKNAHPDKNLYFTEQWTSSKGKFDEDLHWHTKNLIIGASRNWAKTVLEWNLAADPDQKPFTPHGGCSMCLGALTIGEDAVSRNVAYYIIAQASKFVPSGSVRIASTTSDDLPNVAFKTPEGKYVLIVLNENSSDKAFAISLGEASVSSSVKAGAVASFVW
jgi:glucosylceramidase